METETGYLSRVECEFKNFADQDIAASYLRERLA